MKNRRQFRTFATHQWKSRVMSQGKKVGFYTLGCKMNFSETSTTAREFEAAGSVARERGSPPEHLCREQLFGNRACR